MDLASILAITGYFVPVIFEKLLDLLKNHRDGDPNLRGALEKLEIHMLSARTVIPLIRADTNDGLLELLKKLKEAAYEADDLLDELNYLRLKKQVDVGDNMDNHSSQSKHKKASDYLSRKFKIFGKSFFANKKSNTVNMINEIAEQLKLITSEIRSNANLLKKEEPAQNLMESSLSDHRVTTSLLRSEQNVLGREKERDEIIELLLNPPAPDAAVASSKNIIFVLPIVGIGGVGKTTLAQLVYNNERVKPKFDVRMWVHISNQFDVVRLTREMLEGLGVPKSDLPTSLNSMQELLKAKLSSKRFLLVLDDVWKSERSNWEKLCAPLGSEQPGCWILMTTRQVTDVSIMDNEIHTMSPIKLIGLLEKEYWSLFEKCAFGGEDVGNHPKLAEIGKQIAKKLCGSPLAAKTLGGLLRVKLNVDHWRSILESDIWKLQQNIDDIMPALRLSYQHLSPHLQQCFAYCSVFPKGFRFDVNELVPMWIAQGYVQNKTSSEKKRLMDIGREYFHELERMYFFEANMFDQCLVHDLLHDLAEYVSADEYFRIDGTKQLEGIPRTVRHLFARSDMIKMDVLKSSCNLRNLRTLIIDGEFKYHMSPTLEDLFNELRRVRVLYFMSIDKVNLPKKIGDMIHLRYICAGNLEYKQHYSSNQLYQLQFLMYSSSIRYNLLLIGKMTCLQILDVFYVRKEEGHGIGQLKNLRELGGRLKLRNLENVSSKTEAVEAQLNQKEHLLELRLCWNDSMNTSAKVAEEVLEGLQPPPYIKELRIDSYPGVKSPTWVSGLTFLTKLKISNSPLEDRDLTHFLQDLMRLSTLIIFRCSKITTLPLLDGLHRPKALTELYISNCPELMTMVGLQALVSLETLSVVECPKLMSIVGLQALVSLETLYVKGCPKLLISTSTCTGVVLKDDQTLRVRELTIDDPALLTVLLKTQSLHYLQSLNIQFCGLTYLNIEEEICSHLTALKKHEISFCGNLESLQQPAYLKSLPSLEEFNVISCHNLQLLPLMPASLKTLFISCCHSLPKGRYKEGGEDWYNIAHVNTISIWD